MIAVKTKGKKIKNTLFKHVIYFIHRFVSNDSCKNKGKND